MYLQAYAVAFIDILGQGEKLRDLRGCEWWLLDEKTRNLLSETYGSVSRFRELYNLFMAGLLKPTDIEKEFLASNPSAEDISLWKASKINDTEVKFIADSIFTMVPLGITSGIFPFDKILCFTGASCNAILSSFCEHRAIQGAVSLGPCIVNRELSEVYGSALSIAVELEKKADWPRIIVDEEIVRVANIFAQNTDKEKPSRLNATFAKKCLQLITKDEDDQLILDYLGPGIRKLYDIPDYFETKANEFITKQLSEKKNDDKILRKYKQVQKYFLKHGIK